MTTLGAAGRLLGRWSVWTVLAAAAVVLVWVLPSEGLVHSIVARAIGVAAIVAFTAGLRRTRAEVRGVWANFWLYAVFTVIADIIYDVQQHAGGRVPFPGVTDVLYLGTYAFAFLSLWQLVRMLGPERDLAAWIDAGIISAAVGSLVIVLVIEPLALAQAGLSTGSVVSMAYPVLDLVTLAVLIRTLVVPRMANRALVLIATSMLVFLGYDIVYNYLAVSGDWTSHPLRDVVRSVALLALTAAVFSSGAQDFAFRSLGTADRVTRTRALVLGVAVVLPPLLTLEQTVVARTGGVRWLALADLLAVLLLALRAFLLLRTVQDQARQISGQARTDPLTGLPNRRSWDFGLQRALDAATEAQQPLVVALLDLDYFKVLNDDQGHRAGDAYLLECVKAWRAATQSRMQLARYGGEEFGILLPGLSLQGAVPVLEGIRAATPAGCTVSIGAIETVAGELPADATNRAEMALYRAKEHGRNRLVTEP